MKKSEGLWVGLEKRQCLMMCYETIIQNIVIFIQFDDIPRLHSQNIEEDISHR